MTVSKFPALHYALPNAQRHLAFSSVGDAQSAHVLLCLPGLLETRATFDPLLLATQELPGLRVVSLDMCGRGDSSPLPNDKGYSMQVYFDDIVQFIHAEIRPADKRVPHIDLLGTSMGGILAMYLAHDAHLHINGLFFNDIGLDLPWLSIYSLYDGMKKAGRSPTPEEMAEKFHVSIGAVLAVQSPSHFDLPYRKDWNGMKFDHLLKGFKGPVRLVHGSLSKVCGAQQVQQLQQQFPKAQVLEVAGATHPVPFTAPVNAFVLQALNLPIGVPVNPEASADSVQAVLFQDEPMAAVTLPPAPQSSPPHLSKTKPLAEPQIEQQPLPDTKTKLPPPPPPPPPQFQPQPQPLQPKKSRQNWLSLFKRLLSATKK